MASGFDSCVTGIDVIGASLDVDDLHTEDHETEIKVCLLICVTMGIVEIVTRELLFHLRESDVVSSCLDNGIAMTNPHVCTTFMPNDMDPTNALTIDSYASCSHANT